jgi:hypothetical protein
MMRFSALFAAVLFCTPALADDPYQPVGDNAFGPYAVNPGLTTGTISGFRTLYASAESLTGSLKPAAAATAGGTHVLEIENTALSSVDVTVNDTKVGMLGPLTIGRIHDVGAGEYRVKMGHTTGYVQDITVKTTVVEGSEVAVEKTPEPEAEMPVETPAEE